MQYRQFMSVVQKYRRCCVPVSDIEIFNLYCHCALGIMLMQHILLSLQHISFTLVSALLFLVMAIVCGLSKVKR